MKKHIKKLTEKTSEIYREEIKHPIKEEKKHFVSELKEDVVQTKQAVSSFHFVFTDAYRKYIVTPGFAVTVFALVILLITEELKNEYVMLGVFGLYLITLFILKIDSRVSIAGALLLLISVPISLTLNQEPVANQLATYAYFFLVIGVIKQFVEYARSEKTLIDVG